MAMSPANIGLCSSAAYWIQPQCWCMAQSAWGELASIPAIPPPTTGPSVPDYALTNPNQALGDTTGANSQAASDQQITENQTELAQWAAENLPDNPAGGALDPCESLTWNWPAPFDGLNCTTVGMIGAVALFVIFFLGGKR